MEKKIMNYKNKKMIGTLAIGGLLLSAPLAAFAHKGGPQTTLENEQLNTFNELSDEEHLEFLKEEISLKLEHVSTLLSTLEEEGIDVSDFVIISEQYADLIEFLESVDITSTTKEELRETFFELQPQKEGMRELEVILRETFDREELRELKDNFKEEMDTLRETYNLPQKLEGHHQKKSDIKWHKEFNGTAEE